MKKTKNRIKINTLKLPLTVMIVGLAGLWLLKIVLAATPVKLYLTPATQSLAYRQDFAVNIRLDTGQTNIGYVRADLSFPADKLEVSGITASGSAFSTRLNESYDNAAGIIRIERSNPDRVNGDFLVITITMRTKAGGTAAINFLPGAKVAGSKSGENRLQVTTGATYTLASPPQPAPTPQPTPTPTTTPQPTTPRTAAPQPVSPPQPAPTPQPTPTPTEEIPIPQDEESYVDESAVEEFNQSTPVVTKKSSAPIIPIIAGFIVLIAGAGFALFWRARRSSNIINDITDYDLPVNESLAGLATSQVISQPPKPTPNVPLPIPAAITTSAHHNPAPTSPPRQPTPAINHVKSDAKSPTAAQHSQPSPPISHKLSAPGSQSTVPAPPPASPKQAQVIAPPKPTAPQTPPGPVVASGKIVSRNTPGYEEPQDLFEQAEERFKTDDRLKDFR